MRYSSQSGLGVNKSAVLAGYPTSEPIIGKGHEAIYTEPDLGAFTTIKEDQPIRKIFKMNLPVFRIRSTGSTIPHVFWASWIRILLSTSKIARKTLIPTVLWLLLYFWSLKNDVNVPSKSNKQKSLKKIRFLLVSWRSKTKIIGSGFRIRIRIH